MFGIETILALFAPHDCLVCRREGSLLCQVCQTICLVPIPSRCYRCLKPTKLNQMCSTCSSFLDHVWVATDYQKIAARLVKCIKFDRAGAAAKILASVMAAHLPPQPIGTVITHAPTAASRIRQRGYDQAQLIARQLAILCDVPYRPLLGRSGRTRQVGANRQQRQAQLKSAFTVRSTALPNHVLLVDDVLTTGATIEAAARQLKTAGVQTVNAALFAQKSLDL